MLPTESYLTQQARWPQSGRHILALYDEQSIIVYQAYNPAIGRFAAENQFFGGEFSYSRMSWIKTNFLWMMYRSGWGTKPNQEITLAVRIKQSFFDQLLQQAVASSFTASAFDDQTKWKAAIGSSNVRLQWDPDHSPTGAKLERKAVQLGMRGDVLQEYGRNAIVSIEDVSDFVAEQRQYATGGFEKLITPIEEVYKKNEYRS